VGAPPCLLHLLGSLAACVHDMLSHVAHSNTAEHGTTWNATSKKYILIQQCLQLKGALKCNAAEPVLAAVVMLLCFCCSCKPVRKSCSSTASRSSCAERPEER
jgi:hypothetical protein